MRKRLVGIGHAMRVFLLLYRVTAIVRRVENLSRETIGHRLFAASASIGNNPANRQCTAALLVGFYGYLVSRTTNATRLDLNSRLHIVYSALEHLQRLFAGLLSYLLHCPVKDDLGDRFLALPHHPINELGHQRTIVDGIRKYFSSFGNSSSWHNLGVRSPVAGCQSTGLFGSKHRHPVSQLIIFQRPSSVASPRISTVPACDPRLPQNQVFRG